MRFTLLLFLMVSTGPQAIFSTENGNSLSTKLASKAKNAGNYLFSKKGAQDAATAYCLGMGITATHELVGHAFPAKFFYGSPINVTLGAMPYNNGPLKIFGLPLEMGGIRLSGLNPAVGYASHFTRTRGPGDQLKNAAIAAGGPIFGALASLLAYYGALKNKEGLNISKAVALYGLFNHTLGFAGLFGTVAIPNSDGAQMIKALREYFRNKP